MYQSLINGILGGKFTIDPNGNVGQQISEEVMLLTSKGKCSEATSSGFLNIISQLLEYAPELDASIPKTYRGLKKRKLNDGVMPMVRITLQVLDKVTQETGTMGNIRAIPVSQLDRNFHEVLLPTIMVIKCTRFN